METRPRTRQMLRRATVAAALGALVVPATASAATKTPVITTVTPKNVSVGETLIVNGRNFRVGKGKNTLLFKRDGGKALFVKAGLATKKKITLSVPKSLEKYMAVKAGAPVASRFRLRVLTTKLSRSFTAAKSSPTIGPEKVKPADTGTATPVLDPNADCDADGLTNAFEEGVLKTAPCVADTDGDGATDGYEYASAVDLNNDDYRRPTVSLPYPGKRPYPNPLDAKDAGLDHDGDSLSLGTEFALWRYTVAGGADPSLLRLTYSAGLKFSVYSGGNGTARVPALAAGGYDKQAQFEAWVATSGYATIDLPDQTDVNFFDVNRDGVVNPAPVGGQRHSESAYYDSHGRSAVYGADGWLADDERDEDADGLTNRQEIVAEMVPAFWKGEYAGEPGYPIGYEGTSPTDADSDGDGVRDGADDQDHDDVPNFHEMSRNMISGRLDAKDASLDNVASTPVNGRVNPFNPCLPFIYSRTCPVSIPFENKWAPFHTTNPKYFVFN